MISVDLKSAESIKDSNLEKQFGGTQSIKGDPNIELMDYAEKEKADFKRVIDESRASQRNGGSSTLGSLQGSIKNVE